MPAKKPADRRQGRGTNDAGLVVLKGELDVPDPSDDWLEITADEWERFWRSDSAQMVRQQHRPAVRRLFEWRDRQQRAWKKAELYRERAEDEALVSGSKGQPVANPLFDLAAKAEDDALKIESKIVALEDRFGLSVAKEVQIGVQFVQGQSQLADLNDRLADALKESTGDDPFDDEEAS